MTARMMEIKTWFKEHFFVSTDSSVIPIDDLCSIFDSDDLYWAKSLPRDAMKAMLANSLCFGMYEPLSSSVSQQVQNHSPKFIGFARCVTDFVTFVYLTDVWVDRAYRGQGLGAWMVGCVNEFIGEMPCLRRAMLTTADWERSVPFYEKLLEMSLVQTEHGSGVAIMSRKGRGHPGFGKSGETQICVMTNRRHNKNASRVADVHDVRRPVPSSKSTKKACDKSWQFTTSSKNNRRDHQTDVSYFDVRPTNDAERAWRSRDAHKRTIRIPPELVTAGRTQGFDVVAQRHESYLGPLLDKGRNVYGIWASTSAQAEAAADALLKWINDHTQSNNKPKSSLFPKMRSVQLQEQEKLERQWKKEVAKYTFRQIPNPGTVFQSIGYFIWPPEEAKLQDALGKSLEVLDAIRSRYACHILPSADGSRIEVLGKSKNVIEAVVRIRQTFFQIIARERKTLHACFAHWHKENGTPNTIAYELYTPPNQSKSASSDRLPARWCVDTWREDDQGHTPDRTLKQLGHMIERALASLRYYNADITFNIRLGMFAATTYLKLQENAFLTFDDFLSMLDEPDFKGFVSDESNHASGLRHLRSASRLRPSALSAARQLDVVPRRTATFLFHYDGSTYELTSTWDEICDANDEIVYQRASDKWLKLLSDSGRHQILDLSLLRLDTDLLFSAWHFDMSAGIIVSPSEVPDALRSFADHIGQPHVSRKRSENIPFVSFSSPATGLQYMINTTASTYQFVDSGWTVKVFESQRWEYERSQGLTMKISKTYPSFRSCYVHHAQWDDMLSANAALPIGEGVAWSPALNNWFPLETADTGQSGLDECLEKMVYIERILDGQADYRYGGMTVA